MGENKELYDEIERVAYDLYEQRERVHGHHLEDWLGAERTVLERHAKGIEREDNTQGSTKVQKTPSKTEPKPLKTSKKTPGGSSQTRTKKSPPKKKT